MGKDDDSMPAPRAVQSADPLLAYLRKQPWRGWKWVALVALASSFWLGMALAASYRSRPRAVAETDERLIGTWQSDAERTIEEYRKRRPMDEKRERAFRQIFGKLRIIYSEATYVIDLDGTTEQHEYRVLGRDKNSVAIREIDPQPSPLDKLIGPNDFTMQTEFTLIQFEGADSYWVFVSLGDHREYFKRVR
jgi:hypothetical protein